MMRLNKLGVTTPRERELLDETEWTRPVDFHSWRRAFNQALADAGVNAQQAQALAGHSLMAAHERYLRNSEKVREVPEAALPKLIVTVSSDTEPLDTEWKNGHESGRSMMGTLPKSSDIMSPHGERDIQKLADTISQTTNYVRFKARKRTAGLASLGHA